MLGMVAAGAVISCQRTVWSHLLEARGLGKLGLGKLGLAHEVGSLLEKLLGSLLRLRKQVSWSLGLLQRNLPSSSSGKISLLHLEYQPQ
jgi:hypothetical protein